MNALRYTLATNGYQKATPTITGNGNLQTIRVKSKSSSAMWIHIFDVAATPSASTVPSVPPIPIAANGYYESDTRIDFTNGLHIAASSVEGSLTAIGADDVFIEAQVDRQ